MKIHDLNREDFNSLSLFEWLYSLDLTDYLIITGECVDHARRIKCYRWFRELQKIYERKILMNFVREQFSQNGGAISPAMKIIIPLINKYDRCRTYWEVN